MPPRVARAMIMVAAETAGVLPGLPGLAGLAEAMAGMAKAKATVVEARPHRRPTVRARRATKFQRERIL